MYIPVEGDPALVRDNKNGSIVNIDKTGYQAYIARRDKELSEKEKREIWKLRLNLSKMTLER